MAGDNKSLGQFDLAGIAPAPRGVPQIQVCFNISADGIVEVSAKDLATGKEHSISITANGGLTQDEIDQMIKTAEENAEQDRQRKELVEARNNAQTAIASAEKSIDDNQDKIPEDLRTEVQSAIKAVQEILDSQPTVEQINQSVTDLINKSMKVGEHLYKVNQPATGE
jgi:molecular chaperone DnaK